jgi:hypothetical protein
MVRLSKFPVKALVLVVRPPAAVNDRGHTHGDKALRALQSLLARADEVIE